MSADAERTHWDAVDDADLFGVPAYDVDEVAKRIIGQANLLGLHKRLLDLGCGPGRLTNHIARLLGDRVNVYGWDISMRLVERAISSAPPNAHYMQVGGRTLPKVQCPWFSGAYSVTMFQHIPDDAKWGYIHQVHDLLVPGGTFVFTLAHGNISTFLNHQTPSLVAFGTELALIYDKVTVEHEPDERGWHWVAARKAAT